MLIASLIIAGLSSLDKYVHFFCEDTVDLGNIFCCCHLFFSDTCVGTHSAVMWEEILYWKTFHNQVVLQTHYSIF
jgi:hypothetical protein